MTNIFNFIFILIIGYIISNIFFNLTPNNKPIDHFDTLTPAPTPDLTPAPYPVILTPAPYPVILTPAPTPDLTPAPSPVILTPAPSPVLAPAPYSLAPAFAPSPGPSPFVVNGVNMTDYTANYYSLFNSKPDPTKKINNAVLPSFYMLDIPVPALAPAPTAQETKISVAKKITPEQEARSTIGTVTFQTEFSKIYPIGTNFDPIYSNYTSLISNTSIGLLNEILAATKFKANQNSRIINFNSGLKQVKSLLIKEEDVIEYGKYLISTMNSVSSVGNSFEFVKVNPIVKEQYENQVRINFTVETLYKYPKSKNESLEIKPTDFKLLINVVLLFEKSFSNPKPETYLETASILGLSSSGYLSGYSKSKNN